MTSSLPVVYHIPMMMLISLQMFSIALTKRKIGRISAAIMPTMAFLPLKIATWNTTMCKLPVTIS